jgi:hypothetical protein
MGSEAMNEELTTLKKVLIAAATLDGDKLTFSAEDVIVRAWKVFPESFGLNGYRDAHPDSNRVLAKLMGSVGLCGRGWLEQTNTKTYRLTPAGRKVARSLGWSPGEAFSSADSVADSAGSPDASAPSLPVDRSVTAPSVAVPPVARAASRRGPAEARPTVPAAVNDATSSERERASSSASPSGRVGRADAEAAVFDEVPALTRIATSIASQKFARGGMITFDDACAFWGISRTTVGSVLVERLAEFEDLMVRAEAHVRRTGAPVRTNGRFEVTLTTVVGLQGLHRMLLQRYQRELDGIRAREG